MVDCGVVAGVLHNPFANGKGQVKAAKRRIALLKPGNDAQRMQVVVEAEAMSLKRLVERLFAGMSEGRMTDVVHKGKSLRKLPIESKSVRQGAGDLGDFKRVREAAAKMVTGRLALKPRKHLGLAGQAAERSRVQDARRIAGKGRAVGVRRLGMGAAGQLALCIAADGDFAGELKRGLV